jgi:hypothetical protein
MIFFSFVCLKKHFFKKMLGRIVKKSSFLGATLNLHRGKTVKFFKYFQIYMIPMAKISQTKKSELSIMPLS